MCTGDFSSEGEALLAAGNIVEAVAYRRAGYWTRSHVVNLMLIAADLQRLSEKTVSDLSEEGDPSDRDVVNKP